jgi:hypothetical protein
MRYTRKPLLFLILVGMAAAVPALAQSPSTYPAACDASKVSKIDVERAHTVFLSGKGFLDESNYDKAISYFKDAYSIDCSVHGILPIIATAYERKGDKAEAIHALGEYILRVPNTPDREVIERRIRNLREQLAQERPTATAVTTGPNGTTTAVPTATTTVPTGDTGSTATATPPTSSTGSPPPPAAGEHSVAPWALVGGGGALVVTGAVLLVVGSGKVSSANNACPTHAQCPQSVADDGNAGRLMETIGIIGGIAGIVGVGAGLVWHFTEGGPAQTASTSRGTYVTPVVTPGFAGMSLGGSF